MKNFKILILSTAFLLSSVGAYAFTCNGVYHNGSTDNSWFGDSWDDFWGLDWEEELDTCFTKVSGDLGLDGFSLEAVAGGEAKGCGGGSGSCCEEKCPDGSAR